MIPREVLFIGGPLDGERKVLEPIPMYSVPLPCGEIPNAKKAPEYPSINAFDYRGYTIESAGQIFTIYLQIKMSVEDALGRLIECYRPK